jgi:hypothetical protein
MSATDRNPQQAGTPGVRHRVRLPIIIVALLVAAIGAAIIGGLYQALGGARQQAQRVAATERAALLKQADAQHANTVKQSLNLFGVPLAWAMGREIAADNWEQVDRYVSELVKLEGVEEVAVARSDGAIAAASDPRHVGVAFSSLYAERYLAADEVVADEITPGQWLLVTPVQDLGTRLGTVVVAYRLPPFALAPAPR